MKKSRFSEQLHRASMRRPISNFLRHPVVLPVLDSTERLRSSRWLAIGI